LEAGKTSRSNAQATSGRHTSVNRRWSLIKNSAVEVSDERAIDAFIIGLRRRDLVEEMGKIKPKTVSDLMDVANRFTDGEDACNNKRT
jgi:hypothetical protein